MIKKRIDLEVVLYLLSVCVSLLIIIAVFSGLVANNDSINAFFNSDTLYLPSLYKDLFIDHNSLKGWEINPAPNFFPDMLCYFIISYFSNDFIISSFVFPVIQYVFLLFIIRKLFKIVIPDHSLLFSVIANILMLLFFFVTFFSNDFNFTFYLISNSYHMGTFLMAFLCLVMSLFYLKDSKNQYLIIILLVSFLCIVSDRLFMVLYSFPIFSIVIFYTKINPKKKLWFLLITNIIAIGIGLITFNYLYTCKYFTIPPPHKLMDFNNITSSYNMLSRQMWVYITDLNYKTTIVCGSILSLFLMTYIFLANFRKEKQLSFFTLYSFISVVFIIFVFFAPVISGSYTGWDIIRYNIYVFYVSLINYGVIAAYFFNKFHNNKYYLYSIKGLAIICIIITSVIGYKQLSYSGLKQYFTFYPEKVKCLDDLSKKEKLLCGVGNYWEAKYITMFSKNNVKVYSANDDLIPYHHVTNTNWFYNDDAVFNFVVLNNFSDREAFKKRIGNNFNKIDSGCVDVIKVSEYRYCPNPLDLYFTDSLKNINTSK